MDPLIIIPARAGSKGIPKKNFRPLVGLSPVNRAIHCARTVVHKNIIVTIDAPITVDTALLIHTPSGVLVHPRPSELSTDTASMADVVIDVLQAFPGPTTQPVLLVQPTQPLRTPWHLQRALNLLQTYVRVVSVVETEPAQKLWFTAFEPVAGPPITNRQDARLTWRCDGTVYGFRRHAFESHPVFITPLTHMMILDPAESCPLDTELDWHLAELRLQETLRHDSH